MWREYISFSVKLQRLSLLLTVLFKSVFATIFNDVSLLQFFQVAASPKYMDVSEVPKDIIDKEMQIIRSEPDANGPLILESFISYI